MFAKKPLPPHSDNLTPAQVSLLRKMIKTEWEHTLWDKTDKALKNNWPEVLVAFARQPKIRQGQMEWIFIALCNDASAQKHAVHLQLLPEIGHMTEKFCGVRLGTFLALIKDEPDLQQQAVDCLKNARVRGQALLCLTNTGDISAHTRVIEMLMTDDIDLHFEKAALIKQCLQREHYALADRIIAKGFDLPLYSQDLIKFSLENDLPHAARLYLDNLLREVGIDSKQPAKAAEVIKTEGYLRSGDCVSCIDTLPDGSVLTTVFNFASGQQLIVMRVGDAISAPAVVNFSTLEERHQLESAAKAYVEQGGDGDLAARFATTPKRVIAAKPEVKS